MSSFVRRLALRLLGALAVPATVGWYVASTFFPLTDAQRDSVRVAIPIAIAIAGLVSAVALAGFSAPIQRALDAAAGARGPLRRRAAVSALRLPTRIASVLLLVSCGLVALVVALEVRRGLAPDLAVAAAATGTAFAIMAAMLGYSVGATGVAPAIVELGSVDTGERGTVRGKVLVVSYGLLAIATLLVGSVAYARYRTDADQQYVEDALSAQEHGARWLETKGPAAAAELVHLATGAPTAVVSPRGVMAARAGDGAIGMLALPPAPGSGVEVVPGGWRVRRAAGPLTLVTFLSDAPLRERRSAFWGQASLLGVALFGAAALLVWLAAKSLTVPIGFLGQAADRIASGDLTASPPSVSRDELGQLAVDFRRMAHGLSLLVTDVQAASRGVEVATRDMGDIGVRVKGGAGEEHERVLAVEAAVEAMQGSMAMVGQGIDGLADYVHSTSSAVGEMAAALDEVRQQAGDLERRMDSANTDVERLSEAGRRAQTQLGALDALAGNAEGTLASVSASLSGLETTAVASQLAAAQAAEMAEHAGSVVQETVGGIESLRSAVGDAKKRVTVLGRRSDDIDQILDFIGEVAGRTNLLSLNASIIATQAGEHGKAFAVVADQIRELAAQISSSTKSIGEIIRAVRDDVSGTARLIDRGDELATEGVAHARKSLDALHEIRAATAKGHETAAAIREAVQAHAHSTRDVSNLVSSIAQSSHSLTEAVQMVGKSVSAVGAVSRGVGALADKVSRALEEQTGLGRQQLESLERINGMLADVTRAVGNHDSATHRVRQALSHLSGTARQHEAVVVELSGVAERLGGRSRALAERVAKFKI
jgi:methyl-accepting chemotaxis protein